MTLSRGKKCADFVINTRRAGEGGSGREREGEASAGSLVIGVLRSNNWIMHRIIICGDGGCGWWRGRGSKERERGQKGEKTRQLVVHDKIVIAVATNK